MGNPLVAEAGTEPLAGLAARITGQHEQNNDQRAEHNVQREENNGEHDEQNNSQHTQNSNGQPPYRSNAVSGEDIVSTTVTIAGAPLLSELRIPAQIAATATSGGNAATAGGETGESEVSWTAQLRRMAGEEAVEHLARLDAAARAGKTLAATIGDGGGARADDAAGEDEGGPKGTGGVTRIVRISAGRGVCNKADRARVHRAVQETFPFVKVGVLAGYLPGIVLVALCFAL